MNDFKTVSLLLHQSLSVIFYYYWNRIRSNFYTIAIQIFRFQHKSVCDSNILHKCQHCLETFGATRLPAYDTSMCNTIWYVMQVHDVSEDSCGEMNYHADKIAP
jgi:hypothetical protein